VLERLRDSALPDWYVAGGCLFQTVWNVAHGFEPTYGIQDYDLFYFDDRDLSAVGEAEVAGRVSARLADVPVRLDVRNQARVHEWYEAEFGVPSPVFRSTEDGIDHFLATCCSFGVRRTADADRVYAPWGYADLFDLVVRPNPVRAASGEPLRASYERKTRRWQALWPRLQVIPWPGPGEPAPAGTRR
jgi:hypothetical protein